MLKRAFVFLILLATQQTFAQTFCTTGEVRTEVIINAPIDSVWKMLISIEKYPEWNPFICEVKGKFKVKSFLKFKMKTQDGTIKKFSAKLLVLNKNESFAWGGSLLFLFKAKHYFLLNAIDPNTTKLVQGEYWKGLFGKAYGKKVYQSACYNFNAMNEKMKDVLEKH